MLQNVRMAQQKLYSSGHGEKEGEKKTRASSTETATAETTTTKNMHWNGAFKE